MIDPVRIGIVGAGAWARTTHAPLLCDLPEARLVAVASRSPENRRALCEASSASLRQYGDPDGLFADADVEAVLIATPNYTHEDLAVRALAAGKHLLCETALSLTVDGYDRVAAAWRAAGTTLAVDLELRASDVAQRLRELILTGHIGLPRLISCLMLRDWGRFCDSGAELARCGGMFVEVGTHYLDLFNLLANDDPARVFATGGDVLGIGHPDYLWTTVEYEGGVRASLGMSVFAAGQGKSALHVIGTEGCLEAEIISGQVQLWRRGQATPEDYSPARRGVPAPGLPGSRELLQDFARCVRSGGVPIVDFEVARAATALALAAARSYACGSPVVPSSREQTA
ncbi:MAG: Gfo/Idh/MocA family oxidoreductase [Armatimonadetes bacterium]|nr:Gfo/Idh/MocA family oxidoreductase [Armatimonadota bacterium]